MSKGKEIGRREETRGGKEKGGGEKVNNSQIAKKSAEQIWNDIIGRSILFFETARPSIKHVIIEDWEQIIKANIDSVITNLEKQNADLKNDNRIHLDRIRELKEKISVLEIEISGLKNQIDDLKAYLREAETEIDRMGDRE